YVGMLVGNDGTSNIEIVGNNIHSNGEVNTFGTSGRYGYGFNIDAANVLIEGNDIHDNAYYGICFYGADGTRLRDNIVRNNRVYNNELVGDAVGILVGGSGHLVYDNLIWNERNGAVAVGYSGARDISVYENTFYGYGSGFYVVPGQDITNVQIYNNII